MTDEIQVTKRRVVRKKEVVSIDIEDGIPVVKTTPEEVVEYEGEEPNEEFVRDGVSPLVIPTEHGDAIYTYAGMCFECGNKRPPVQRPVFVFASGYAGANDRVGVQLASFRRDGRGASPLCQECYNDWMNKQPKRDSSYKVL